MTEHTDETEEEFQRRLDEQANLAAALLPFLPPPLMPDTAAAEAESPNLIRFPSASRARIHWWQSYAAEHQDSETGLVRAHSGSIRLAAAGHEVLKFQSPWGPCNLTLDINTGPARGSLSTIRIRVADLPRSPTASVMLEIYFHGTVPSPPVLIDTTTNALRTGLVVPTGKVPANVDELDWSLRIGSAR